MFARVSAYHADEDSDKLMGALAACEAGGAARRLPRAEISGASVDSVDHFEVGLIAVAPGVEPAGRRPDPAEEPGEEPV